MSFQPFRLRPEQVVFRGMSKSWIDKKTEPWGAKLKAYLRQAKDDDGITVMPKVYFCCALNISGIGRIKVGDIESLSNPATKEQLHVLQDAEDHALIVN